MATAVFDGIVKRLVAMSSWFSSELRHSTTFAAVACFSLFPVCGTVQTSPPSGATAVPPASGAGSFAMP